MARRVSIEEINQTDLRILLDTNVLIDAFHQPLGPVDTQLVRVARNKLYTIDLVLWEFLQPGRVSQEQVKSRLNWLRQRSIRRMNEWPPAIWKSFRVLLTLNRPQGTPSPVDGTLMACTLALRKRYVLATADRDDFADVPGIGLVAEFLPPRSPR
jgi:predicted nucleic acid-binding protein